MEIKFDGNPGSNNTFVVAGKIEHSYSNVNTVNNTYYNGQDVNKCGGKCSRSSGPAADTIDTDPIREEILRYVSSVRPLLSDAWKQPFMQLWGEILGLQAVAEEVYECGKQQGTNFNRSLVAQILHYLDRQRFYQDPYSATAMAVKLEGSKEHTVRNSLGQLPPEAVVHALDRYFEERKLK